MCACSLPNYLSMNIQMYNALNYARGEKSQILSSSGEVYFFIDQYTLAIDAIFFRKISFVVLRDREIRWHNFFSPIHETSMSSSDDPVVASPFIFGQHPFRAGVDKGCDGAAPKAAEGGVERDVSSRL